jgi:hypothetical protein
MPDKVSSFVPNTKPPPTDDAVAAAKPEGKASDAAKTQGVQSITGQPLQGESLDKFKKLWDMSPMIRGMYNEDGSIKENIESLVKE